MQLEYDSKKIAELIESSVSPDNEEYIRVKVDGPILYCYAEAKNPMQLLHTLDDFLACITIAEETIEN